MITDYDPFTFEYVLNDPYLVSEYGIHDNNIPEDYGFESEEISYSSADGTRLNGWYVKAKKPTSKSLVFVHGRTSNRLKTMKYLSLVDSLQLDTCYNVFLPDMRNSGKSESARTYMGYKFGEDLVASLNLLQERYDQDTFMLYGFSMGAMAILNSLQRPDLKEQHQGKLHIEKVILDSPLVNVKETLFSQSDRIPASAYLFDEVFSLYSSEINGFGEQMNMATLIDPETPTLILQSRDDSTTRPEVLANELERIPSQSKLHVAYFEGPGHVKMFQDERTKVAYLNEVKRFLEL